jgi:hypothetical protein
VQRDGSHVRGYLLSAIVGAVLGGCAVARATNAAPKIMAGMMQTMSARMREMGMNPHDM